MTTTGGSVLDALAAVREAGGDAEAVVTVIDREEGAREALAAQGVDLIALATMGQLVPSRGEGRSTHLSRIP